MDSVDQELTRRLAEAERIVRTAGQLAKTRFEKVGELKVERKGLQDYVSAADREVEALIKAELDRTFAGEAFLGEESGGVIGDPIWVADPIDGTSNFLRSVPLYGISLALVHRGRTKVGLIYLPELDELYTATTQTPALLNGTSIQVRKPQSLAESLVIIGFNPSRPTDEYLRYLRRLFDARCEFRRFGSATFALCMVAAGRVDGFWQQHLKPWDALAGLLIVERAGGRVSDFIANDGIRVGNAVLAASPSIADELSMLVEVPLAPL